MPSKKVTSANAAQKRVNHQGCHPHMSPRAQTGLVQVAKANRATPAKLTKKVKQQAKMAEKRMSKLSNASDLSKHLSRSTVVKAALPAATKQVKKVAAKTIKKDGFLSFSPFDDRFPVFFESYSPWDSRFPYGHVPREFPSFSPFDARFPVNGNGLFRNMYLAKQAEKAKAAAARNVAYTGYLAMFGKTNLPVKVVAKKVSSKSSSQATTGQKGRNLVTKQAAAKQAAVTSKPTAGVPRHATHLPAAAFTYAAGQSQTTAPALAPFPRFSPMARTGALPQATNGSSGRMAPSAQSPLSAMRARANGGAAASPVTRRPQQMR